MLRFREPFNNNCPELKLITGQEAYHRDSLLALQLDSNVSNQDIIEALAEYRCLKESTAVPDARNAKSGSLLGQAELQCMQSYS